MMKKLLCFIISILIISNLSTFSSFAQGFNEINYSDFKQVISGDTWYTKKTSKGYIHVIRYEMQ